MRESQDEDLHIHDFRGRAGVDALLDDEGEEDIKAARKLLGHKSEGMTRHYVGGQVSQGREALALTAEEWPAHQESNPEPPA